MPDGINYGRRGMLKTIGGVSLGLTASGNAFAQSTPDVDSKIKLGNVVKHPNDNISDNITARHTAGVEVLEAVGSGTHWHIPLHVAQNTRTHTYGDKSDERYRIYVSSFRVNSPKPLNTQNDELHLGAYKYKEEIDGPATTTHAESTLSYTMTLISAALSWGVAASVMASAFAGVASSAISDDIHRYWSWDERGEYPRPTPEQSTWLKFELDSVEDGEVAEVDIQTQSDMNTFDTFQAFSTRTEDNLLLGAPSYSPSDILGLRTDEVHGTNATVHEARDLPASRTASLDASGSDKVVTAPVAVRKRD